MKARFAAGDAELGERYVEALLPMVWTACEREDFVPEVQAMRRRVEQLVPADIRGRELKLGSGGLRDVEFAAQIADRAVMMAEGQIVADGAPATVMGNSPLFAPQTARLFPNQNWLTPEQLI